PGPPMEPGGPPVQTPRGSGAATAAPSRPSQPSEPPDGPTPGATPAPYPSPRRESEPPDGPIPGATPAPYPSSRPPSPREVRQILREAAEDWPEEHDLDTRVLKAPMQPGESIWENAIQTPESSNVYSFAY